MKRSGSAVWLRAWSAACALFVLAGCAEKPFRYAASDLSGRLQSSTAVLPFDNASTDLDAEKICREAVIRELEGRGYRVVSREATDAALKRIGVTDGGQLPAYKPQELGRATGTPGLVYGTIEEFMSQNIGVYANRKVVLRLRWVDADSGERLFEDVGTGASREFSKPEKATEAFLKNLARKAADKARGIFLKAEAEKAAAQALKELPRR
ncbi:MAG: GNA1162 family protein [Elusimicrobiota bacterium]